MSQTGKNKKLASFNCDQKTWEQFIARCNSDGTTATATLTQFIKRYLNGYLDDLDGSDLEKRLDSKIKARVEEYLAASNNNSAKEENQEAGEILAGSGGEKSPTRGEVCTGRGQFLNSIFPPAPVPLLRASNQAILDICERLDKLESQNVGESNSKETEAIHNFADLEPKIEAITARMKQLTEAILKIQDYLNNQLKQPKKSYNNSYYQRSAQRIQPLTEEGLAARLGVSQETIREQRNQLHSPLFVAWCKGKDKSGIGWEFNRNTGLYHPGS
jgi:hypothetical protein